ncbi:MAG: DsbA family protein, partial [Rhizobiaceae bacterium]|nr:DsbA family protein [Rhizobiaceae bacterium]
ISAPTVLGRVLQECGVDPEHWLAQAESDDVKLRLRQFTDQSASKGIFGAPSFVVGDELFWGDDRLEDAIAWAASANAAANVTDTDAEASAP